MAADSTEQATFFRAALLLGLIRGEHVVAWADSVIATEASPSEAFTDLATTPAEDRVRTWLARHERDAVAFLE